MPLAALGFVLAWAYQRTGSLWTCITMHALFNTDRGAAWALTQLTACGRRRRRRRAPDAGELR